MIPASNGGAPTADAPTTVPSELESLRLTCRRQAHMVETLGEAVSAFSAGTNALKAENAALRTECERLRRDAHGRGAGVVSSSMVQRPEVRLALDAHAPGAARAVVGRLSDRAPAGVLSDAQLVMCELVTNGVRHSGAPAGKELVLRIGLSKTMLRLEVEDPGRAGAVAIRPPDIDNGGGFGLNLVQDLSERWGVERVAAAAPACGPSSRLRPVRRSSQSRNASE
jgi:anti-sigma regulatory factor (Ser/Thr protein kinase)